MRRILDAGPSLWQAKHEGLARRTQEVHERAAFCSKLAWSGRCALARATPLRFCVYHAHIHAPQCEGIMHIQAVVVRGRHPP